MSKTLLSLSLAGALCTPLLFPITAPLPQDPAPPAPAPQDMQAMLQKSAKLREPGPHHRLFDRMIGKWKTQTRITMPGHEMPAEAGTAEFAWLMPGRWVKVESSGSMMKMPMQTFVLLGYDNFKMSYVMTSLSSLDTAMLRSEGDVDPKTGALLMYGTLDEYLTGEHDKMVKSVWRFPSADRMLLEVHDLPIGEENTKVFEIAYERVR
jgi:hypothetical protein